MRKALEITAVIIAGILCLKFFLVPLGTHMVKKPVFMVRVRLLHEALSVEISSGSKCRITDKDTGRILRDGYDMREKRLMTRREDGIYLNEEALGSENIDILPDKKDRLFLNGKRFRGDMRVISSDKGLDVINVAELEDYLQGVVPKEMNRFWPFAALRSQAIASRSFAVNKVLTRKNDTYDLRSDTFSQVYGGVDSERWRTTRAVTSTKGEVLVYDGKVVPAYFHACCGGYTRDVSDAWGSNKQNTLKSVKCSWCAWSPHFRWRIKLPPEEITEKLVKNGYPIERIDDIVGGKRDSSKRLKYLRIKSGNRWFEINVSEFRSAVGRKTIRSSNFYVKKYPRFYLFSGYGWGHGVGMCQWGTFGLALKRKTAEQILDVYYPGSKIMNMKDLRIIK
ncbi:MAG: SpoIID/LytB domain-containing protein [Candidatus Omnitrophota bacterium]